MIEFKWILTLREDEVSIEDWKMVKGFLKKNNIKFHESQIIKTYKDTVRKG